MNIDNIIRHPANIVLAVVIVDIIALVLARNGVVGKVVNEWYDKFSFGAFVSDVGSICFGIFLALVLFKYVLPENSFTLVNFVISVVIIQLVHDLLFSQVIKYYPRKQNRMMDVFKGYVNENGWKILAVDATMMIMSVLLIYAFAKVDDSIIYMMLAFFLYFSQFLIYS